MVNVQRCKRLCQPPKTLKGSRRFAGCGVCLIILAIILFIIAATAPEAIENLVNGELRKIVVMDSPDNFSYDTWVDNSAQPLTLKCYVNEILNPYEILNNGSAPVYLERGPYVYRATKKIYNVTWSDDGDIVNYRTWDYNTFVPEESVEPFDNRTILTLNIPFWAVWGSMQSNPIGHDIMLLMFVGFLPHTFEEMVFKKQTIHEVLFGFTDRVLQFLHTQEPSVAPWFPGFVGNQTNTTQAEVNGQNIFAMHTGKKDMNKIRTYTVWKNLTTLRMCPEVPCPPKPYAPPWTSTAANQISGGDGAQFPMGLSQNRNYKVWFGHLWRYVNLTFAYEYVYKGITMWRYIVPMTTYANASHWPSNIPYYSNLMDGFANVSMVAQNAPAFISKPHFMGAPGMKNRYYGIWPKESPWPLNPEFDTYFDLEPRSGMTLHAESSVQMNFLIGPITDMPIVDSPNKTVWFPNMQKNLPISIFWASQEGGLSDQQAKDFIGNVYLALLIGDSSYYAGLTFGTLFLIGGVLTAVTGFRRYYQFRTGAMQESIGLSGDEESIGRRNGKFAPLRRDDAIEDPRGLPPSAHESGLHSHTHGHTHSGSGAVSIPSNGNGSSQYQASHSVP